MKVAEMLSFHLNVIQDRKLEQINQAVCLRTF